MPATKKKVKRRHKYCPVCEEITAMPVVREAEDENDLYWLLCSSCDNIFALTKHEYQREKRPKMLAIKKNDARIYRTNQTYSVGELIYHPKLNDVGLIMDKVPLPSVNCTGSIIVSFSEIGQKTLVEGYA